jgi:hypothetical protein
VKITRNAVTWRDEGGNEYVDVHETRAPDNPAHIPGTRLVDVYARCGHIVAVVVQDRMPLLYRVQDHTPSAALTPEGWRYLMIFDGKAGTIGSPAAAYLLDCIRCGTEGRITARDALAAVAARRGRRARRVSLH